MEVNKLAQLLLLEVKRNGEIEHYVHALETVDLQVLNNSLQTENQKKAFWINLYNAFSQVQLKKHILSKEKYYNPFTTKSIVIAQKSLSLDDIEHGILRKSSWKLSFGYLKKLIVSSFEKEFRVQIVDPRIHFALNCGARSCPPIRHYSVNNLDEELNIATRSFLENNISYDIQKRKLIVSRLFLFYKGDFGGTKGVLQLFDKFGYTIPKNSSVKYAPYDWTPEMDNYKE